MVAILEAFNAGMTAQRRHPVNHESPTGKGRLTGNGNSKPWQRCWGFVILAPTLMGPLGP